MINCVDLKTVIRFVICSAFQRYKSCFSSDGSAKAYQIYQACTERVLGLLLDENQFQRKFTKEQATGYVMMIAQLEYACGAGFSSNRQFKFYF